MFLIVLANAAVSVFVEVRQPRICILSLILCFMLTLNFPMQCSHLCLVVFQEASTLCPEVILTNSLNLNKSMDSRTLFIERLKSFAISFFLCSFSVTNLQKCNLKKSIHIHLQLSSRIHTAHVQCTLPALHRVHSTGVTSSASNLLYVTNQIEFTVA